MMAAGDPGSSIASPGVPIACGPQALGEAMRA